MSSGAKVESDRSAVVRVGIVGEFNSGKSSVANLLLRRPLMPTSVDHSRLPPVDIELVGADQLADPSNRAELRQSDELDAVHELPVPIGHLHQADSVVTAAPVVDLEDVIVTEISVSEDGRLSDESAKALAAMDFIVWCTMGQRAWCLSELNIIQGIRPDQLERSLLAITRADFLKNGAGQKVLDRVTDLASEYFPTILLVNASNRAIRSAEDDGAWVDAGGEALLAAVTESVAFVRARSGRDTVVSLSDYAAQKKADSVDLLKDAEAIAVAWRRELDSVQTEFVGGKGMPNGVLLDEIRGRLWHVISRMPSDADAPPLGRTFRRAHAYLVNQPADDLTAVKLALELRDRFAPTDFRAANHNTTSVERNAHVTR